MPVRTRRLGGPVALAALGVATIYTVPANRTAIVKRIQIRAAGAYTAGTAVTFYVGAPAAATAVLVYPSVSGLDAETWLVLHEGETLQVGNGTNVSVTITVSGTLLDGDPS